VEGWGFGQEKVADPLRRIIASSVGWFLVWGSGFRVEVCAVHGLPLGEGVVAGTEPCFLKQHEHLSDIYVHIL